MHITRFPLFRMFPVSSNNELQTLLLTIETSLRRDNVCSAVARPNGQPRQAGGARGVRGHAPPPPPEKF